MNLTFFSHFKLYIRRVLNMQMIPIDLHSSTTHLVDAVESACTI
jgi:antitoxin component of RelBE/YafQ-DinJ toxin-antitoxin module